MARDRRRTRKYRSARSRSVLLLRRALSVECSGRHAAGWSSRERPSQCQRNVARRHTYRELLQLFALPEEHSDPLSAAKACIVLPLIVAAAGLTACLFIWVLGSN
jgi:hypothetical protein